MDEQATEQPKLHHYLVAGNVIISDDQENVQSILQNALITSDVDQVSGYQLGKAQQALQVTLFNKMGSVPNVVDVVILNIAYLGHMTHEEFAWVPEGLTVQEREEPPTPSNVIDFTAESQNRNG